MKTFLVFISCLLILTINSSIANNISVSNISLNVQNIQNHYTFIKFDIQWYNSWRTASAPGNWDAAWIFVKYRVNSGQWQHAWLNDAGHNNPPGSTMRSLFL
jgi:hypothetical protein